jgi:group I intron endonuclease
MYKYCIYKITSPSGKFYIGVTNNFRRRMSEHLSDWKNRTEKIALHNSFTKYGFENHRKEILITGLPKNMAYDIEKKLVQKLESNNSKIGLNSRDGGSGGNMIDWNSDYGKEIRNKNISIIKDKTKKIWDERLPIIMAMKKDYTTKEIAKKLNCATSALGRYCKENNINIDIKRKYDLSEVSNKIKPYIDNGMNNKDIMQITGYSKGTFGRAKKLLFLTN